MAMPYKSPLARLPAKRAKNAKPPKLLPPETLRLPDGRVIQTKDVVDKQTNKTSYNLREGIEYGHRRRRKMAKDKVDAVSEK